MSNIIPFAKRAVRTVAVCRPAYRCDDEEQSFGRKPKTETARNFQLRMERRDAWSAVSREVNYWRARMDLHNAIASVQRAGLPEGDLHPEAVPKDYHELLRNYRLAFARKLLTPAHRQADIDWKQKALEAGQHNYTSLTRERVEYAIDQDIEFMKTYPVRGRRPKRP
jgi:hypothetical protein